MWPITQRRNLSVLIDMKLIIIYCINPKPWALVDSHPNHLVRFPTPSVKWRALRPPKLTLDGCYLDILLNINNTDFQ